MTNLTKLVVENQLWFILSAGVVGVAITIWMLRRPGQEVNWKISDLLWVLIGGAGAIVTVIVSMHLSRIAAVQHRVDSVGAMIGSLNTSADRFLARQCVDDATPAVQPDIAEMVQSVCAQTDMIAMATAAEGALARFVALLGTDDADLSGLDRVQPILIDAGVPMRADVLSFAKHWRMFRDGAMPDDTAMTMEFMQQIEAFEFMAPVDAGMAAADSVAAQIPPYQYNDFAAQFTALHDEYDATFRLVETLRDDWQAILNRNFLLVLRVFSISVLAFLLPIRAGKSIFDIISSRPNRIG